MKEIRPTPDKIPTINTKDKTDALTYEASPGHLARKEELSQAVKKLNLFCDKFMAVALKDKAACQHVLRILTGIQDLTVIQVQTHHPIAKLISHDAYLDVLAEDSSGKLYNIEIQRKDVVDHARRTRFYASMIDSEFLEAGKTYAELPDVYVIYISITDLWKAGYTTYPVEKKFANTALSYDDGLHVLYINAAVDDGSEKARLMKYFKTANPDDMSQGALSRRIRHLKNGKGGADSMNDSTKDPMQESEEAEKFIYNAGKADGLEEGREEGRNTTLFSTAQNMHKEGFSDASIARLLEVTLETIQQWLTQGMAPAK